jgi:hypothetical protein
MKQILNLRQVYHRLKERIRAHVVLCWVALLLIRVIENTTGQTWHHVRRDLDRLHRGHLYRPHRDLPPEHRPTNPQTDLYARLDLPVPKKVIKITPQRPEQPQRCGLVLQRHLRQGGGVCPRRR